MESIALRLATATTTAPARVSAAADLDARTSALQRLARARPLIELGALVVIHATWRAAYARRRLGWRAQGAVATWEYRSRPRDHRSASRRATKRP